MTPAELLESVKLRFVPLLHNEPQPLYALLRQTLLAYQDRAGVIKTHTITTTTTQPLPDHFLARIAVKDSNLDFVSSNSSTGMLNLNLIGDEQPPLSLTYLVDLGSVDFNSYELPVTAIGLLSDYLEALIAIPNTQRIRRIAIAGKIDASDLESHAELVERKLALEEAMAARREIVSPFSFTG